MKKLISVLLMIVMIFVLFCVPAFAENSDTDSFELSLHSGEGKVVISWDELQNADHYNVSINSDVEYYCVNETVEDTHYDWVPDYNVSPGVVFDITVSACDSTCEVIAESFEVQAYIVTRLCDYFGYYGDVDGDEDPSVMDATFIQKHLANDEDFNAMQKQIADVDYDGTLSVMDATYIQQFCAAIITDENRTGQSFALGWVEYDVFHEKWWE